MNDTTDQTQQFALCLNNEGYPASLEVGKLYRVIPDEEAAAHGYICLIDESGEDSAFIRRSLSHKRTYRTLWGRRYWRLHDHNAGLTRRGSDDACCAVVPWRESPRGPFARCAGG